MGFLSFVVLLGIAYLLWRVTDQLPDLIFRLSEIQRDIAEIRRRQTDGGSAPAAGTTTAAESSSASTSENA
jgi:hypothetical protein